MAQKGNTDSNQLLNFVNQVSTDVQEALNRHHKGKKVNHRKYIQKRLQHGGKSTRKNAKLRATPVPQQVGRQPIASLNATQVSTSDYDPFFQYVPATPAPLADICQTSQEQDEISSIFQEMGMPPELFMDSPSHCSLYSDSTEDLCRTNSTFSNSSSNSLQQVLPSEYYAFSPNSDFSDVDDSAYSSPRNASPINGYYTNSPPVPTMTTTSSGAYYPPSQTWIPTTSSTTASMTYDYPAVFDLYRFP